MSPEQCNGIICLPKGPSGEVVSVQFKGAIKKFSAGVGTPPLPTDAMFGP
jgi:hypothetical protein